MREVGAFEAKNTLGSLLDEVERGGEVIITRRGKRVARLVPDRPVADKAAAMAAVRRIEARRACSGIHISAEEWKAFVNEGRR